MKLFWKNNINNLFLNSYDLLVNKINCRYIWKCSEKNIHKLYSKNLKENHLEIGPGTGYFLNKYKFKNLHLMDINSSILEKSKKNLYPNCDNINIYQHNIFQKNNPIEIENIQSIGINYVLHCVPGELSFSFNNLIKNLNQNNLNIFGSTVIPENNIDLANLELQFLNYFEIFNNKKHDDKELIDFLDSKKYLYQTKKIGYSLLFSIKK